MNVKYKTQKGKERKFISARKGETSKSEVARKIMADMSGKSTYKDIVDAIQEATQLSRMLAQRYVKVNSSRVEGFTTTDGHYGTRAKKD